LRRTFAGLRVCCESGESADFDAVVNCSYADIGRLTAQLGYTVPARRYEYTVIPIIDWLPHPFGMTVMDGPFFTVLPFGKTSQHLLYHVTHSVVAESTQELMNSSWLANDAPSLAADNIDRIFAQMRADAEGFVPSLREATMVGYLHGPRMVLKDAEVTDARPSIAQWHDDRYVTVFSGKVDHSILVADSLARQMATQFGVREGRGLA
jgi:glycine/D-amino acid oxidase-like deaminating enzyme